MGRALRACTRSEMGLSLFQETLEKGDALAGAPPPTRAPTGALVGSPESPEVVAIADGGELEEEGRKRGEGNNEEEEQPEPEPEEIPDQIDI